MAHPRDVSPDETVLKRIFGDNQPSSVSVILQDWDKCVCKAVFPDALENGRFSCILRLEARDSSSANFIMVAAMQEIAATCIPGLVPETLQLGSVTDGKGRDFQYSTTEFIEGNTLEEIWDDMASEDRQSIAAAIVEALSKLHSLRLSDTKVQAILRRVLGEESEEIVKKAVMGGPFIGFLNDGSSLLHSIEKRLALRRPFHTTEPIADPKGLVIKSKFEDIGASIVRDSDMEQWVKEAVLCHNDLNPRNLMVRSIESTDGKAGYKLAAMIDWELAGFFPPSYEISLQDTYLCGSCFSFYLLLKEGMKDICPPTSSQVSLLRAMELLYESQQRQLFEGKNIGAHIRRRFMEVLQLSRDEDPYVGWTCKTEGKQLPELSRADTDKLENDVIDDMIERGLINASRVIRG
ncbi:phosphotransferase enzyme family-domain-containing protein [Nemania sp. NC0429]|nr:phosphotransferase enzyme family-domain-containing protein [Nemania sp. NC0429]